MVDGKRRCRCSLSNVRGVVGGGLRVGPQLLHVASVLRQQLVLELRRAGERQALCGVHHLQRRKKHTCCRASGGAGGRQHLLSQLARLSPPRASQPPGVS